MVLVITPWIYKDTQPHLYILGTQATQRNNIYLYFLTHPTPPQTSRLWTVNSHFS